MVLTIPKNVTIYNFNTWIYKYDDNNYNGVKKWLKHGGNSRGWIVLSSVIEWIFFGGDVIDWINNEGDAKLWTDFLGNVDLWLSQKGNIKLWIQNKGTLANWITYNGNYDLWIKNSDNTFNTWLEKYKLNSWIEWKLSGGNLDSWCWICKQTNGNFIINKNNIEYNFNIKKDFLELINIMN